MREEKGSEQQPRLLLVCDAWRGVFAHLGFVDVLRCRQVSRELRRSAEEHLNHVTTCTLATQRKVANPDDMLRVVARLSPNVAVLRLSLPFNQHTPSLAAFRHSLTTLHLAACRDLPPLRGLRRLQELRIEASTLEELRDLNHVTSQLNPEAMLSLAVPNCCQVESIASVHALPNLTSLDLSGCFAIPTFSALRHLPRLRSLHASGCERLMQQPDVLLCLGSLERLDVSRCWRCRDVSPLRGLHRLQWLDMSWMSQVEAIQVLSYLTSLTHVRLDQCSRLASLQPLLRLPSLRSVSMHDPPAAHLATLAQLRARGVVVCT